MTDQIKKENSISFFLNDPKALRSSLNTFIKPHGIIKDKDKNVLLEFWFEYFMKKLQNDKFSSVLNSNSEIDVDKQLLQDDGTTLCKDVSKSIFTNLYKDDVFKLLESNQSSELSVSDLENLQIEIESLTMNFHEESMYSQCPTLIKEMNSGNKMSAKEYLKCKYKMDKRKDDLTRISVVTSQDEMNEIGTTDVLTPNEKGLLDLFSHHTLEALLIHIMSTLFSTENYVRVATLVERIEYAVRQNAAILSKMNGAIKVDLKCEISMKNVLRFPFGQALVEFLVDRKMINIILKENDISKIRKKNKSYYSEKYVFAECVFNPSLLPVKMNLPMISPPKDWEVNCPRDKTMLNISDLTGGYLKCDSTEIYGHYRLLSSLNLNNFHIYFGSNKELKSHGKAFKLCKIMNKLQKQAFKINKFFLDELTSNVNLYVQNGLLMPYYLNNFNISGSTILREDYLNNKEVQGICSYNKLLQVLSTNIQQARYERTLFNLAKAYEGYQFYLPAFLDFRGRIYRCGILHFHERDLARSLIQIVSEPNISQTENFFSVKNNLQVSLMECAGFHYQKFSTYLNAVDFILNQINDNINRLYLHDNSSEDLSLLYNELATNASFEAKNPFQFLSLLQGIINSMKLSSKDAIRYLNEFPITKDASASAYQIMSYFMLDKTMGLRTNLIQSMDPDMQHIQDIYSFFRIELLSFLKDKLDELVYTSIESIFTRKLVKSLFMPLIYGKTLMSTNDDIKAELSQYMTHKECLNITRLCFKFWSTKYEHMDCLISLIRIIGWFASTCDRPVQYHTDFFNTSQDYRKMEPYSIWVYDKTSKKRRKVTLRVSSEKRDRKKTEVSTFVNFIHQKDAYIAMRVVHNMSSLSNSPIYTVHDNFISNALYSIYLPKMYLKTIQNMGPPLKIINEFLIQNLFLPVMNRMNSDDENTSRVIPPQMIDKYLALNIPEHFKKDKSRLKVWDKNVSRLKTYYNMYIKNVTGGSYLWEDHERNWVEFKKQLDGKYCIHL